MNFNSIILLASKLIDHNKIGGWVRAIVAAGFVALIAKYPILGSYVDPALQTQIAAAIAAAIVGVWSQLTKTPEAKVAAVVELANDPKSPVQGVITTDTNEGRKLAASIVGPVVAAGTNEAKEISKS